MFIARLGLRDVQRSMRFDAAHFVKNEPTSVALRLTTCDYVTTFSDIMTRAIAGGHSYAMIEGDTIVGQILNIPYDEYIQSSLTYGHIRETAAMHALFDALDPVSFPPSECMYVFSVSSNMGQRGVATALLEATLENSKHAYKYVMGDCTNHISQHIFRKKGFLVQSMVPYDSFEYGVNKPFRTIEGTAGIARMVYQHAPYEYSTRVKSPCEP